MKKTEMNDRLKQIEAWEAFWREIHRKEYLYYEMRELENENNMHKDI